MNITKESLLIFLKRYGNKIEHFKLDARKPFPGQQPNNEDIFLFLEQCPNLKKLIINNYELNQEDAKRLANNYSFTKLKTLDLSANNIKDEGAIAIGNSPNLKNIKILNLDFNNMGLKSSEGIKAIATNLTNLISLSLRGNKFTANQILEVDESLERLKALDLTENNIFRKDLHLIAYRPLYRKIRFLKIVPEWE